MNPVRITIIDLVIHWPADHEELEKVKLGKDDIWKLGDSDSPTKMPPWSSLEDKRDIKGGDDKDLEFQFKEGYGAAFTSYNLVITFEIEGTGSLCTLHYP